jgi:predicted amidohydrolase
MKVGTYCFKHTALLQFTPIHSDVKANVAQADKLIERLLDTPVDIIILPEMCFTVTIADIWVPAS